MTKIFLKVVLLFFMVSANATDEVLCLPENDINECINRIDAGVIKLTPGMYLTSGVFLKSDITLKVPRGAVIKLKDEAEFNMQDFGGVMVNAVILAKGSQEQPVVNVHIDLDGEINANKGINTPDKGGWEGINYAWVESSSITGSGTIHSASGDGIDLDAVKKVLVKGVTVRDNDGTGVHFGSPRPIHGSIGNVVMNVKSINNGFLAKRNGFDLSWPNPNGAVFINVHAKDNYRNFEIEATGGTVVNSFSIDNGKVVKPDDFGGASFAHVNGKDVTKKRWISLKREILIKRDIKKILGMEYPGYLDGVEY